MTTADGHDVFLRISLHEPGGGLEFRRETPEPQGRELVAQVHVQRTIAAPPQQVFDWLLDPVNLTASPVFRKAGWAKDSSGPGVGAVREVIGIGYWAHEQITAYDAPRSCSYIAVRSFPPAQHNGGTLTCTPSGDGTHVDWVSGYTLPARSGGKVIEVVTLPLIRWLMFRAILAGCARALES
jgi:Polyketide cyclase / dehydrase and lipid transport